MFETTTQNPLCSTFGVFGRDHRAPFSAKTQVGKIELFKVFDFLNSN